MKKPYPDTLLDVFLKADVDVKELAAPPAASAPKVALDIETTGLHLTDSILAGGIPLGKLTMLCGYENPMPLNYQLMLLQLEGRPLEYPLTEEEKP